MVKGGFDAQTGRTRNDVYAVIGIVSDDGVGDVQVQVTGFVNGNTVTGIEPEDDAVLHVNGLGLEDVYSAYAITESVNGYTSYRDYVSSGCVDDDTVDERSKDRSERAAAVESDRVV